MTKNIIFDFGRVLVHFEEADLTAAYISDKADIELATPIIFDRLYWDKADAGTMRAEEIKRAFCKRLPKRLHESASLLYDNWYTLLQPIAGMPEIVRDLKKQGCKLYLLSNIDEEFADNYARNDTVNRLFSMFDGLVFSAKVKMVKPQKEIFNFLLNTYGLNPQDCTFIDDSPKNLAAAESLGIKTYRFDGSPEHLRQFLWQ